MNSSKNKLNSKKTDFMGQCQTQPKSLNTTIPTTCPHEESGGIMNPHRLIKFFYHLQPLQKTGTILEFLNRWDSLKKCWYSPKCPIQALFFPALCSVAQQV